MFGGQHRFPKPLSDSSFLCRFSFTSSDILSQSFSCKLGHCFFHTGPGYLVRFSNRQPPCARGEITKLTSSPVLALAGPSLTMKPRIPHGVCLNLFLEAHEGFGSTKSTFLSSTLQAFSKGGFRDVKSLKRFRFHWHLTSVGGEKIQISKLFSRRTENLQRGIQSDTSLTRDQI